MWRPFRRGPRGCSSTPYLSGERCPYWDGRLRASFTGATFGHRPRALPSGPLTKVRPSPCGDALRVLDDLGGPRGTITVVGGGTAGSAVDPDRLRRPGEAPAGIAGDGFRIRRGAAGPGGNRPLPRMSPRRWPDPGRSWKSFHPIPERAGSLHCALSALPGDPTENSNRSTTPWPAETAPGPQKASSLNTRWAALRSGGGVDRPLCSRRGPGRGSP